MSDIKSKLFVQTVPSPTPSLDKITICGTGQVGIACAVTLLAQGFTSEIALVDVDDAHMRGEMLDLQHGALFLQNARIVASTDYAVTAGSKICIITAGVRQVGGESRLDLLKRNVEIFRQIVPKMVQHSPDAVFLVVSNPVDVLAFVTWRLSGLPAHRVIGSGTNLDSSRFRHLIAERLGVAPGACHGWVIGEHGASAVSVWSGVNVAGTRLRDVEPRIGEKWQDLHERVVKSAPEVRELKGYTNWAVGLSCAAICRAILRNENEVYAVSTNVKGVHGITKDLYLSLPCVMNSKGVGQIVVQNLSEEELGKLKKSAEILQSAQDDTKL